MKRACSIGTGPLWELAEPCAGLSGNKWGVVAVIPTVPTPRVRWSSAAMKEQVLAHLQASCLAPSRLWCSSMEIQRPAGPLQLVSGKIGHPKLWSTICHLPYCWSKKGWCSLHPDKDRPLPYLIKLAPLPEPQRQDTGTAILEFVEQVNLQLPSVQWEQTSTPGRVFLQCCSKGLVLCSCLMLASGGPLLQLQLW